MRKDNCDALLAAYDIMFKKLGMNLKRGMKEVCDAMEDHLRKLKQIRSRHALEAMLMKEPELSPGQLDAHIEAIRLLPRQLRKILPAASREVAQKLPYDRGGRPRRLNREQCKALCGQIGDLFVRGVKLTVAQKRIAVRQGVSLRTVQRAWRARKSGLESSDSEPPT